MSVLGLPRRLKIRPPDGWIGNPQLPRIHQLMRTPSHRQSGQAAVETAIVMPLFVFIILGLLQLGLMHQAHLMAKYASYKAVRAGSLNRGDKEVMRRAALAVLLPLTNN